MALFKHKDPNALTNNLIKNLEKQQSVKESKGLTCTDYITQDIKNNILSESACHRTTVSNFNKFKKDLKDNLLGEAFNMIYAKALNKINMNEETILNTKKVIESYIIENGSNNILNRMQYRTVLLSELYQTINKYYDKIVENCNEDNCKDKEYVVPQNLKDEFYDELDMSDTDDVVLQITDRVNSSIEEFINQNTMNKLNIKDVLKSAQERVSSTKDELQHESVKNASARMIHDIKNNGTVNLLTAMVEKTCKTIIGDEVLRESYMDGTNLNMKSIVNNCIMSYTMMEMTNTLGLELFNQDTLTQFIKEI